VNVSGVVHTIDDGLLRHPLLDEVECVDPLAERRLLARTIQRAAVGGNVQLISADGPWALPVESHGVPVRLSPAYTDGNASDASPVHAV